MIACDWEDLKDVLLIEIEFCLVSSVVLINLLVVGSTGTHNISRWCSDHISFVRPSIEEEESSNGGGERSVNHLLSSLSPNQTWKWKTFSAMLKNVSVRESIVEQISKLSTSHVCFTN